MTGSIHIRLSDTGALAAVPTNSSPDGKLSPKRPRTETMGLADLFPYYAGFSFQWARTHLEEQITDNSNVALDPWNGSGTTTLAAQSLGIRSIGSDLNPVATLVARIRGQSSFYIEPCAPPRARGNLRVSTTDPLLFWFTTASVAHIRRWVASGRRESTQKFDLLRLALFRVVRKLTFGFEGSNPTWVRRASCEEDLVDVAQGDLNALIMEEQNQIVMRLRDSFEPKAQSALLTASSNQLPLKSRSIDLILTSPPYLTRIDYAVAYSRELAILGVNLIEDRSLRAGLMGTTLIRPHADIGISFGSLAEGLVKDVSQHKSKASSGYYLKQVKQYLTDLVSGITEISRVARPGAAMILVVQDSYYKDIPIRLAEICAQEAEIKGWESSDRHAFEVSRSLTTVNTAARAYSKGKVSETVLTLVRSSR